MMTLIKLLLSNKRYDDRFQSSQIGAAPEQPLYITPELRRLSNGERHSYLFQSAKRSAVV